MTREVNDTLLPVNGCSPLDMIGLRAFKGYSHEASVIMVVNPIKGESYCETSGLSKQVSMFM